MSATKHEKFIGEYQARWGRFPASTDYEKEVWHKFIDSVWERNIEALMDKVSEIRGDDKILPRLDVFKKARAQVIRDINSSEDLVPKSKCGLCIEKAGWLYFTVKKYSYSTPCVCDYGQFINSKLPPKYQLDPELKQKIVKRILRERQPVSKEYATKEERKALWAQVWDTLESKYDLRKKTA